MFEPYRIYHEQAGGAVAGAVATTPPAPPAPPAPPEADPRLQQLTNENLITKLENVRLRALIDFPQADKEVLNLVQGTEEEIRTAAQRLHEKALQAAQAVQPTNVPPTSSPAPPPSLGTPQSGPAPSPSPGEVPPAESQDDAAYRRTAMAVKGGMRKAVDQVDLDNFQQIAWQKGWNRHIAQRKSGRGDF